MNANKVAAALRAQQIPVVSVTEGDSSVDGDVVITDSLSVQVPTRGAWLGVVRRHGDEFEFFPESKSLAIIARQIRDVLSES